MKEKENKRARKSFAFAFVLFIFTVLALTATGASAQETSGDFSPGSVKIGFDSNTCNGGLAGAMRYNSGIPCVEFCDGSAWACTSGASIGGCTAPSLCPNVGDVCDDSNGGTSNDPIFAGFLVYGNSTCKPLFVTDDNQSTSSQWKTTSGGNDIATDSTEDGQINDGQIADSATWPAFKLCKDLTDGGFTDWYLPARTELDLLWRNSTAINVNAGNFITTSMDHYWASTELANSNGAIQWFGSTGYQYDEDAKNSSGNNVRCVRRD